MKKVIVIILILLIITGGVTGFSFFKSYKEKEEFFDIAYNTVYNEDGDIKSYTFKGTSTNLNTNEIISYIEFYYDGENNKTLENYKYGEEGYIEYNELTENSEIRYYLTYGDDVWFKEVEELDEYGYSDNFDGQISDMSIILDAKSVKKLEDNIYELKYSKEYMDELSSEDEIIENIEGKVYINNGYVVKAEIETVSSNAEIKRMNTKLVFELTDINSTIVGIPDDIKNSAKEVSYED